MTLRISLLLLFSVYHIYFLLILIYITLFVVAFVHCVCSFVCCVSFERGAILCDVCYLCVVSCCSTTATG
jgi:hypothetical protein